MIILEHGIAYHEKICNECKASLGYVDQDIQISQSNSRIGYTIVSTTYTQYIVCPECGNKIILKVTVKEW